MFNLLFVLMILVLSSYPAHALTGSGTSSSPYIISTADDLAQFRDIVNGGDNDAWGVLTQDIDLSQLTDEAERENWTPIGYSPSEDKSSAYRGTFNGQGHEITNLQINRPEESNIGFFGYVSTGAVITDLSISGTVVGYSYVGGIVGWNNDGTISNCINTGTVTGTGSNTGGISGENNGTAEECRNFGEVNGSEEVGGITGVSRNGSSVVNCANSGTVNGTGENIGGVTGYTNDILVNCMNSGTVTGSGTARYVGGVTGYNFTGTMKDCVNIGSVSGDSFLGGIAGWNSGAISNCRNGQYKGAAVNTVTGASFIGGIAGQNNNGTITNCTNYNTVTGTGTDIGGIVGYNSYTAVANNVNEGNISGNSEVGGIVGSIDNGGTVVNCSNTGAINGGNMVGGITGNNFDGSASHCANSGEVTGTGERVGGIVGEGYQGIITNCTNSGTVTGAGYYIGGVTGYNCGYSQVINCQNSNTVEGYRDNVGGVVGYNNGTVTSSSNSGVINGPTPSGTVTFSGKGGVVGYNTGTVSSCSNSGTVTGTAYNTGGVVGQNMSTGTVTNCVNTGGIKGVNEVGGVIGDNYGSALNCVNMGTVSGQSDIGGCFGQNSRDGQNTPGTVRNCSNSGTVTGSDLVGGVIGELELSASATNCGWLERTASSDKGIGNPDNGEEPDAPDVSNGDGWPSHGMELESLSVSRAIGDQVDVPDEPDPEPDPDDPIELDTAKVFQFTAEQLPSVITTAIPSIDKTVLYTDKRETATISFKTYQSEPSNRFNAASGFMRNLKAESDSPDVVLIVSVNQTSGTVIVRAQGSGTAKITVTANLYATDFASIEKYVTEPTQVSLTYYVTSIVPLKGISLSTDSLTLAPGSSTELSVIYSPENATNKDITWTCSKPELVQIEPAATQGTVKVTALGTTIAPVTITAQAEEGGYTASCGVAVREPSASVTVKLLTEDGLYPALGTLYVADSVNGTVVEHPGVPVNKNGTMTCSILEQSDGYRLGAALLNSLISGIDASPDTEDFTDSPLYIIEGDLNNDNVIDGTDYTILVQRMHFGGGLSEYGLTGDFNYDGTVDDQDLMFFNSPVTHTGESRFMQKGFDMTGASVQTEAAAVNSSASALDFALQIKQAENDIYEISFKKATEPANMLQVALTGDIYAITPSLPEGYSLIGKHSGDGRTVIAIGNTFEGGVSIPADTPVLTVAAVSVPRIIYRHNATTMQVAEESGVRIIPLDGGQSSIIEVQSPAAQSSSGSSSGCNTGLGAFALLAAVPLFCHKKQNH